MQTSAYSIPRRFAECAVRHAGRVAVSAPGAEWTYAELDQRSNFIAGQILDRSADDSRPVALLLEHDAPLISGILGALKAGKIYLALDPNQPKDRLAAVVADSQAGIVLADNFNMATARSLGSEKMPVLEITDDRIVPSTRMSLPEVAPEAGAWLMFTSGSTGTPKGVWQNHSGVIHHTDIYSGLIQLSPDDRLSLLTSCGLAASATHLFGALLNGATLCPFHLPSQGLERLATWLRERRISVFHSVPTVFRHLARAAEKNSFETVRLIRLGGEPVLQGDVEAFRRHVPDHCRLLHALSSTETGLISALMIDKQTALPNRRVPAGRTVPGVEVILLDEHGQPVRDNVEGKIAVRSAHLCPGYWRQPDATMEKFRADENNPRLRIFISNDLGRFLPDGSLEHLGRADQLVKIRGQRADLSEVEAALVATELVKEAVVTAQESKSGKNGLAAYVVPRTGANITSQHFRRALRGLLPAHMVPNIFVVLERLPQTAAGKIDRRALPSPPPENTKGLGRRQRPRDIAERRLTRIWESALNISPIARHDDFFELGGSSLQSVEVLLDVEEEFGVSLPPSTLAEHSTIEKLAAFLADNVVIPSPSPLVKLRDGGGGRPLFLIHSGQGDVTSYGLLTRRLPDRPIYGLQSVGMQGEGWPLMSVPAMARRYLPEILARDPTGPYLIAGTCMGGMVALELAQMLVQQGKNVGLLCLLDSGFHTPDPEPPKWRRRAYVSLRARLHEARRKLRWKIIRAAGLGRNSRLLPEYRRLVVHYNARAYRSYLPGFYPGQLTLFITADTKFAGADPRLMMRQFAQGARLIAIPGQRQDIFKQPAVVELGRQLQSCMESVEKAGAH